MTTRILAAGVLALGLAVSPIAPAQAQTNVSSAITTATPIALWAITGGVLGAVVWPMISTGGFVMTPISSVGALWNPGAAVGTVVGGVGYYMTR